MYPAGMMTNKLFFGCALGANFALALLTACGGRVILDAGEVGAGGAGSSTSSGSGQTGSGSTGSGQTSTGSTGTGTSNDVNATCQVVCDAIEKGGCPTPDCAKDCMNSYATAGDCADEFAALVFCYGDHLDALVKCGEPIACQSLKDAYNNCQSSTGECTPQTCVGDGTGSCSCSVACGPNKYSADCKATPGGQQCLCNLNGMPVGKCTDVNVCDIYKGCCGLYLFGMGGP